MNNPNTPKILIISSDTGGGHRSAAAARRSGVYAFWTMIVLLTALWLISLGGEPPPSLRSLAIVNTVFFAIVEAWAFWMNRMRREHESFGKIVQTNPVV